MPDQPLYHPASGHHRPRAHQHGRRRHPHPRRRRHAWFPNLVQYDLGAQRRQRYLYAAPCRASGCPTFSSIASNANGFVFGTAVSGSPYTTGATMNAGSGVPCNYPISGGTATYCGGASPTTTAAPTTSAGSISPWLRAIPTSSMPRSARSTGTPPAAAATPMAVSSVPGSTTNGGASLVVPGWLGRRFASGCPVQARRVAGLSAELVRPGRRGRSE